MIRSCPLLWCGALVLIINITGLALLDIYVPEAAPETDVLLDHDIIDIMLPG
jgi:hypothetical protein